MSFQVNEFRAEMVRQGMTVNDVSEKIGIDRASMYRKMNGTSDFMRNEIEKIINVLHLSGDDVLRIFFA